MAKYGKPKSAFGRKGPGQMSREGAGPKKPKHGRRAPVDLASGKPTQPLTTWQKVKRYATRAERREIPADTMEKRMASISRTATKAIGGRGGGTRPRGQIDIETERRKTAGPSGFTQQTQRSQELSLAMKKRKGQRVTAADVPQARRAVDPGVSVRDPRAPGPAKVTRIKGPTETDLGAYRVKGYKPPAKPKPKRKPGRKIPKRAPTFMEMLRGQTK